jgi:RNA polymerase sigma-70 factor (ECF subfamily)
MLDSDRHNAQATPRVFMATRWTMVLQAAQWSASKGTSPQASQAMADLCSSYWYPMYAYVRHRGYEAAEAEDLTQEFFATLLAKDYLASVDPAKGRFRHFLLATMKHFLANAWDRAHAQKRGGGQTILSLNWQDAEMRYGMEPSHGLTPEKSYERQWALAVLQRVLDRLQAEFAAAGKQKVFAELKEVLAGADPQESYRAIASRLGTTEGTIKVMAHRLRKRYRELLREEVAQTVANAGEVEEEIQQLIAAVGG